MKRAMVEIPREVCGSVKVGGGKPKSVWWNDEVKAVIKRKESAWKELLGAGDEDSKERCMEVKRSIYQSKKNVKREFGRKMNEGVNGNRELFWKELTNTNREKLESCSRKKKMEMGGWGGEELKCKELEIIITPSVVSLRYDKI